MSAITNQTERLFLFAVDQKIEHLNADFYGQNVHLDAANPENIFIKARDGGVGALATNFGLVARYAKKYKTVNYIIKLNGKTNLFNQELADPRSEQLWQVRDAVTLARHGLPIRGIGYTIYLGSEFEHIMLQQAAQAVVEAHKNGLVAILWIYPRGKSVTHPHSAEVVAGATGVALALGADFVKINPPEETQGKKSAELLISATQAAGNTRVICSGGSTVEILQLLRTVHEQITLGQTAGLAVGRNLISRSVPDAIALARALHAIIYKNESVEAAHALYTKMVNEKTK